MEYKIFGKNPMYATYVDMTDRASRFESGKIYVCIVGGLGKMQMPVSVYYCITKL